MAAALVHRGNVPFAACPESGSHMADVHRRHCCARDAQDANAWWQGPVMCTRSAGSQATEPLAPALGCLVMPCLRDYKCVVLILCGRPSFLNQTKVQNSSRQEGRKLS